MAPQRPRSRRGKAASNSNNRNLLALGAYLMTSLCPIRSAAFCATSSSLSTLPRPAGDRLPASRGVVFVGSFTGLGATVLGTPVAATAAAASGTGRGRAEQNSLSMKQQNVVKVRRKKPSNKNTGGGNGSRRRSKGGPRQDAMGYTEEDFGESYCTTDCTGKVDR